jgi:L-alanine-DL-glutamate epimerase-like enolase superfamily enzyme
VHGVEAIAEVARRSEVSIAIDESAAEPAALAERHCDAICLKIARCGGITGILQRARRARELGYEVYLASTFDGPLGIAAALHAAAAIAPRLPCGLATLRLFDGKPELLAPVAGAIAPPTEPGLGGPELVSWYDA